MKVILKQDVKSLGKQNDMVEVSDGYARNYLLPKSLAVEANKSNLSIMNNKKGSEELKKEKELKDAKNLASKLKDKTIVIKVKAGENGKLFGSITSKDISDKIKAELNLDIDKKRITILESIKVLGTYQIEAKLYHGVTEKFTVKIGQE
jgi:large subunit ribosomal protein L9